MQIDNVWYRHDDAHRIHATQIKDMYPPFKLIDAIIYTLTFIVVEKFTFKIVKDRATRKMKGMASQMLKGKPPKKTKRSDLKMLIAKAMQIMKVREP